MNKILINAKSLIGSELNIEKLEKSVEKNPFHTYLPFGIC